MNNIKQQNGYIALVSLLVVATAGLTIGLAVSISSIEEIQISHGLTQSTKAKNLANACAEDSLERLRNSFVSISQYSLSIGSNSCIIDVAVTGSAATINATGTVDIYNQKVYELNRQVEQLNAVNQQYNQSHYGVK